MARIQFGAIADGVLGSIGGVTFSVNANGYYVKIRRAGSNPRTIRQVARRLDWSQFPSLWNALNAGQRAAWDTWASAPAQQRLDYWGNVYNLTGYHSHIFIGMSSQSAGRSVPVAPPTAPKPPGPTITSAIPSTWPTARVTWLWPAAEFAGFDFICRHVVSDTHSPLFFPYQRAVLTHFIQAPVPNTGFIELNLEDFFGTFAVGQRIWSQAARQTSDGYRSTWATLHGDL